MGIRSIWGNWAQNPQSYLETKKVLPFFQHHIPHWMRSYSIVNAKWVLSYTCFSVFGILGQFGETVPQCPNFLKLSSFIIMTNGALNFLSRMGTINSFSQAIQEILLNNYLRNNFENSDFIDFVPTFWNFTRRKSS